jgi:hypothetical protein
VDGRPIYRLVVERRLHALPSRHPIGWEYFVTHNDREDMPRPGGWQGEDRRGA